MLVSLVSYSILSSTQVVLELPQGFIAILQLPLHCLHPYFPLYTPHYLRRFASIYYFKRSSANRLMVCSVEPVFRPWNPSHPFLWLVHYKTPQICFQSAIGYLSLVIRLRMVCCTHFESCSLHLKEFTPKQTHEQWIFVTYH